jgi:hypothetical protein
LIFYVEFSFVLFAGGELDTEEYFLEGVLGGYLVVVLVPFVLLD